MFGIRSPGLALDHWLFVFNNRSKQELSIMKKIIGIACILALAGCEFNTYPGNYTKADALCKANGGVKKLLVGPAYFDITCNNGATFPAQPKVNHHWK
jgi:hypothetical protein